ncbi:MAG TPA: hypothetical protein VJ032_04685 [Thermoanaerobaculia bacterium]|nr:hypothetical protein [Thermoanaerobaculia bacterium]
MKRARGLAAVAIVIASAISIAAADAPRTRLAFIVSAKRPLHKLSSAELRRIFLGQTSRWSDGHRIILLVRPSNTAEGREFLDRVMRMSEIDYSQWWIGEVFRGRAAGAPRVIDTAEKMIRAVEANADAIGFIARSDDLPHDVNILTIDDER